MPVAAGQGDSSVKPVVDMMMISREAVVDYMTPLGLHHQMATGQHYGPGPWVANLKRPEWNPVYYSKAMQTALASTAPPLEPTRLPNTPRSAGPVRRSARARREVPALAIQHHEAQWWRDASISATSLRYPSMNI